MSIEFPTQSQLDTALQVLEWYHKHMKETEPYATETLKAIETVVDGFPYSVDEIE